MSFFKNLWRPKASVSICSLSGDRFFFSFQSEEDRSFVLNGGPWSFKKMLLLLDVVKEGYVPQHIHLCSQALWVQVFGLPINYMTAKMGKLIRQSLGLVLKVDQNRHGDCLGEFLRVRVVLDVFHPLCRLLKVRLPNRA